MKRKEGLLEEVASAFSAAVGDLAFVYILYLRDFSVEKSGGREWNKIVGEHKI
jgi:hypothetical protein